MGFTWKCFGDTGGNNGMKQPVEIINLAKLPVDPALLKAIMNGDVQVVYAINAKQVLQPQEGGEPSTGFISGEEWYLRNPGERGIHDVKSVPTQALTEDSSRTIPTNRNGTITHIQGRIYGVPTAGNAVLLIDIVRADGDAQYVTDCRVGTGETIVACRGDGAVNLSCHIPLFAGDKVRVRIENGGAAAITFAYAVHIVEFDDTYTGLGGAP